LRLFGKERKWAKRHKTYCAEVGKDCCTGKRKKENGQERERRRRGKNEVTINKLLTKTITSPKKRQRSGGGRGQKEQRNRKLGQQKRKQTGIHPALKKKHENKRIMEGKM